MFETHKLNDKGLDDVKALKSTMSQAVNTVEELDAARANKLREMLNTGDVQVEGMKCLVCHEEITPEELSQMSAEFKLYPAHHDCFDGFDSADEFLAFAAEPAMGCRARI